MRGRSISPETGVASGGGNIVRSGEGERVCGERERDASMSFESSSKGVSDKVTVGTSDVGEVTSVVDILSASGAIAVVNWTSVSAMSAFKDGSDDFDSSDLSFTGGSLANPSKHSI